MKVQMFVLCDAANESHGKLNLLGTFDRIFSAKMPAMHPSCTIAGILRFQKIEEGEHKIKCTFCNADGKLVLPPLEKVIKVKIPPGGSSVNHNMVLNIHGLKLETYGEYSIDLAVNGRHEASVPLYVSPIPKSANQ